MVEDCIWFSAQKYSRTKLTHKLINKIHQYIPRFTKNILIKILHVRFDTIIKRQDE